MLLSLDSAHAVRSVVLGLDYLFAGGSDDKEATHQCRRPGFDPWIRKIPWRREWLPTTHSSILAWRIPCTEEPGGL